MSRTWDQQRYARRKERQEIGDSYTGDWGICELPEEEYQAIVSQRLAEFHGVSQTCGIRRHINQGRHQNDLPRCAQWEAKAPAEAQI